MTSSSKIVPVIMSGGAGSRLWPASRKATPKQLLPLVTDRTMIQDTVARFSDDIYAAPVFVCNAAHAAHIQAQMDEIGQEIGAILVEPMGRDTAACAVIAALHALDVEEDALFLLAPADHHITKPDAFLHAVRAAEPVAREGNLVTFGIDPTYPATGFGYIEKGDLLRPGAFKVAKFVEKPVKSVAKAYLETGDFFWNSGIFLFNAKTLLSEMEQFSPSVSGPAKAAYAAADRSGGIITMDAENFGTALAAPVDKAVMEHTAKAAVIPCDLGWHDVGSFSALRELKADEQGNALTGDVILAESDDILVEADDDVTVAVVGLDNVGVIVRDGLVLVLNLDKSQDVKKVVTHLKSTDRHDKL